jgi:hypothetical protein
MLLGICFPNIFVRGLSDIAGNSIPNAIQCAKRVGACADEVVAPYMVLVCGAKSHARSIVEPQPTARVASVSSVPSALRDARLSPHDPCRPSIRIAAATP